MFVRKVNDMEIPVLGLGTYKMKGKACKKAVKWALDMGYRHLDTAAVYRNEEMVGEAISESDVDRDEIFLTTKVMLSDSRKKWQKPQTNGDVIERANKCLKRLNTDYVDLLLIHWPRPEIPIGESLGAMQKLKDEGRIRHIGVSNFTVELLEEALKANPDVACNQVEMHPFSSPGEDAGILPGE